jgi:hypothetical protein
MKSPPRQSPNNHGAMHSRYIKIKKIKCNHGSGYYGSTARSVRLCYLIDYIVHKKEY